MATSSPRPRTLASKGSCWISVPPSGCVRQKSPRSVLHKLEHCTQTWELDKRQKLIQPICSEPEILLPVDGYAAVLDYTGVMRP